MQMNSKPFGYTCRYDKEDGKQVIRPHLSLSFSFALSIRFKSPALPHVASHRITRSLLGLDRDSFFCGSWKWFLFHASS